MAAPLPESDGDLVRLALEGRQDAFSALYERYFPSVFDFVTRLLRNREEAADVAQDTFIKAMEQLPTLKKPDRFKSWIFTIAHRTGLNRIRSSKRTATVGGSVDDDERSTMAVADADPSVDPEQMAAVQEATDIVWEAAAGLDPRTYAVLDLHVRHGLDSAEIAEVLGVSKGNAYTMVSRMKQTFSKTLSTYLLVQRGRQDCPTLASVIGPDADQMTPELRKRADRHVKKCSTCSSNRLFYLEPLKMFAALMLVPVPAGMKAAIWGSVAAAGAAGAAGAGTAAATTGGAGAASSGGGAAAATTASAAAGAQGAAVGTVAAVATMAAAVVAGAAFLTVQITSSPDPRALEPADAVVIEEPVPEPALTFAAPATDADPTGAASTSTTTSTTITTTTVVVEVPPTPVTIPSTPPPTPTTPPPTTTPPPPTPTTLPPPAPPEFAVADDSAAMAEDTTLRLKVLANDVGPIDAATLELTAAPKHGSAATTAGGEILYTPALDYVGGDQLAYSVTDTLGRSGSGTVDVTVLPINDDPVVPGPGDITVDEDVTLTIDPLEGAFDVDGDELVMSAFDATSAAGGTLVEGSLIYTPPPNFFGSDSFSYTVSDGTASVVITVSVEVAGVADPPSPPAKAIVAEIDEDGIATLDLLAGWSDPDGDELSAVAGSFATAAGGSVTIAADGQAIYTPLPDFNGADSFDFTVTDGTLQTDGSASISVAPVNDIPTADDVTFVVAENVAVGTVLGTIQASDPDGDDLVFAPVEGPIAIDASGVATVGAALDFETASSHTATTTVADGHGGTTEVTVTLQVTGVNEAPILDDITVTLDVGTPLGTVVATLTGTDPDGDELTYSISAGDPEAVFVIDASTGELVFRRSPVDAPFPSELVVVATDPAGLSDDAVVTIEVIDETGPEISHFDADRQRIFAGIEPDLACPAGRDVATLAASVSDMSGVAFVDFLYSGTIEGIDYTGRLGATEVDGKYSAPFSVFVPEALNFLWAEFEFTVEAADTFGNVSSVGGVTVTVRQCPTEGPDAADS